MGNFASNAFVTTVMACEILAKSYLEHQWFCLCAVWLFCLSQSQDDPNHPIDRNNYSQRDFRTET